MKAKPHKGPVLGGAFATLARLVERQRYAEVEQAARRLLRTLPTNPFVLKALSFGLIGQGDYKAAMPVLEQALSQTANDPELHNNLGISLSAVMRWNEALACFDRALALNSEDPEVWKNKGLAFCLMSRWEESIPCLLRAIELFPGDYDEAIDQLAAALLNSGRSEEAFSCYAELSAANPQRADYLGCLIATSLSQCHWDGLEAAVERLRCLSDAFANPAVMPFHALAIPGIAPSELRHIAENHVRQEIPSSVLAGPRLAHGRSAGGDHADRLRIGYLSNDLRNHAVAYVIPQVMELHDRGRVEVFGYSTGPDDGSDIRHRLVRGFDHFSDIRPLGIQESAQKIADDRIDILVDLQGWTSGARAGILALRPAPIQASWLGYAGPTGCERLVDYLIGDPIVTPTEHAPFYVERIARLPHCYLPIDTTRAVGAAPPRAAAGLPEAAFVFCSLNNSYKFNPQVFDVWCALLRETPESCLWLSRPAGKGAENLLREAVARGVAAERIIFASRVASRADYLARLQLADLALDPSPYNSHSSGLDALWAGVPMVTLLGDTFAGRVGASLMSAAGLPECVTASWDEYRGLCLELGRDRDRLRQLRQRLAANRQLSPLFDMKHFVGALEDLYFGMRGADPALGAAAPA